jgi:hypothetical protein
VHDSHRQRVEFAWLQPGAFGCEVFAAQKTSA